MKALARRYLAAAFMILPWLGYSGAAPAIDWNLGLGKSVAGSGNVKSESRTVSGITGISLSLPGLVDIQQGAVEGLTVEADDNLLPLIETVVDQGLLKIRPAAGFASFTARKLKFTVQLKNIDRVDVSGSGDVRAEKLKATALTVGISGSGDIRIVSLETEALTLSIAGSGDFEAGGRAASLRARIAGSGDVKAGGLDAKAVEISISGSGDATVWARDSLSVKVVGSGDVLYYGDAKLKKSIVGSGSVKRLGAAPL